MTRIRPSMKSEASSYTMKGVVNLVHKWHLLQCILWHPAFSFSSWMTVWQCAPALSRKTSLVLLSLSFFLSPRLQNKIINTAFFYEKIFDQILQLKHRLIHFFMCSIWYGFMLLQVVYIGHQIDDSRWSLLARCCKDFCTIALKYISAENYSQ